LAYESGRLSGKDQSQIQRWALGYHLFSRNRDESDKSFEIKKILHLILRGTNSKLYDLAYPTIEANDPDVIPGHTYGVDELPELEKLIQRLDNLSTKTQAQLDKEEWTPWR